MPERPNDTGPAEPKPTSTGEPGQVEKARAFSEPRSARPLLEAPNLYGGILTGAERRATNRPVDSDSELRESLFQIETDFRLDCSDKERWTCVSVTVGLWAGAALGLCCTKQEKYLTIGASTVGPGLIGLGFATGCHRDPDGLMAGVSDLLISGHLVGMIASRTGQKGLAIGLPGMGRSSGIPFRDIEAAIDSSVIQLQTNVERLYGMPAPGTGGRLR
jgi:hypothetical protein